MANKCMTYVKKTNKTAHKDTKSMLYVKKSITFATK